MTKWMRWMRPMGAPRYAAHAAEAAVVSVTTPIRLWAQWVHLWADQVRGRSGEEPIR